MVDPGKGNGEPAPSFLDQTEAQMAKKSLGGDLLPTSAPLSQGLDPALH